MPTVITGDFNCAEGSAGYNALIAEGLSPTNAYGDKAPPSGDGEARRDISTSPLSIICSP